MFEIEVKAKVGDAEAITKKLADLGCVLSDPIRQEDEIFNNKNGFGAKGEPVLRIRNGGGKNLFTVKKDRSGELDCFEAETGVDDPDGMREAIEIMGFNYTVSVKKNRRKGKLGDLEICLDEVDGLGSFIEVEKMSGEDGKKIQAELMEFLVGLGVNPEDRVFEGYDTMMYKKEHGN